MFTEKTRAAKDYSQGNRRRQGKIAKKAGKMRVFFKSQVFVGGVGVFVRQAEAEQDARHFEGVVHLRYERDGTTLANENSLSAKALHQRGLCFLENGIVVGSHPRFSGAQDFKLAADRFRQEHSNVFLHKFGDPVRNLVGYQASRELSKSL